MTKRIAMATVIVALSSTVNAARMLSREHVMVDVPDEKVSYYRDQGFAPMTEQDVAKYKEAERADVAASADRKEKALWGFLLVGIAVFGSLGIRAYKKRFGK